MTAASNSDARKREAEKTQQAARSQKSATGAPNSPEVVGDASGAVDAILTSEQREAVIAAIQSDDRLKAWRPEFWIKVVAEATPAIEQILRQHRAEALADIRKLVDDAQRWIDMAAKAPSVSGDVAAFVHVQLVRDLKVALDRKEQDHA